VAGFAGGNPPQPSFDKGEPASAAGGFSAHWPPRQWSRYIYCADGTRRGEIRDSRIKHPSARTDTPFGARGDLLLTEKERRTAWRLRLDRSGRR
jgi:hypothetical protein